MGQRAQERIFARRLDDRPGDGRRRSDPSQDEQESPPKIGIRFQHRFDDRPNCGLADHRERLRDERPQGEVVVAQGDEKFRNGRTRLGAKGRQVADYFVTPRRRGGTESREEGGDGIVEIPGSHLGTVKGMENAKERCLF
jgi:hypothetical protein